jgi:uncharacterized protein
MNIGDSERASIVEPLCIYHGTCFDGFTAAWIVRRYYGQQVDFHAGVYGKEPPDVKQRKVILVDFSYKRPVMEEIIRWADHVTILDHHKTAEADLADLKHAKIVFDMDRSGAGITWDFFFPDKPRPALINYVEDRDLWRFALPKSREVHSALASYEYDFDVWTELMERPIESFFQDGETLERKHLQDIRALLPVVTREMVIGGHRVPVANMPITMTSDAGNQLAKGQPFGVCYWDTPTGRVFSLRSTAEGIDVSEIAKAYGGGGHRNAAGFEMPRNWEGD